MAAGRRRKKLSSYKWSHVLASISNRYFDLRKLSNETVYFIIMKKNRLFAETKMGP